MEKNQINNNNNNNQNNSRRNNNAPPNKNNKTNNNGKIQCPICGKLGHGEDNCWSKSRASVAKQAGQIELPFISVKIGNYKFNALLDSGASISLIEKRFADYLIKNKLVKRQIDSNLKNVSLASNSMMEISDKILCVDITIANKTFEIQFYQTQTCAYSILLGFNTIKIGIESRYFIFKKQIDLFGQHISTDLL